MSHALRMAVCDVLVHHGHGLGVLVIVMVGQAGCVSHSGAGCVC